MRALAGGRRIAACVSILIAAPACKREAATASAEPPAIEAREDVDDAPVRLAGEPEPVVEADPVRPAETAQPEEATPPRPGVDRLEAFVDCKTIGKSPYAANTLAILDEFPFFVFQDGGLDPMRDVETIHVAGPPYGVHGLEVAARHKLKRHALQHAFEKVMGAHGLAITWSGPFGTPKPAAPGMGELYFGFELVLPDPRHAVLTENRAGVDAVVKRLESLRAEHRGVALAIDWHGVRGWVPREDGTPVQLPVEVSLRVDATKSPEPKVELAFASEEQAKVAHEYLLRDVKALVDSKPELRLVLGSLYDSAKIERAGNVVRIRVELTAEQANLMLSIARGLVDQATPDDDARDTRRAGLRKSAPPK